MAIGIDPAAIAGEGPAQNRGFWVIRLLAVLTAIEYGVAIGVQSRMAIVLLLVLLAVLKAWFIISYFMHLPAAWQREGTHS